MANQNSFMSIFGSQRVDFESPTASHRSDDTKTNSVISDISTFDFQNRMKTSITAFNNATFLHDEMFTNRNCDLGSVKIASMSVSDKKYDPYDYGKTNQSIAFCDTIFHLIFMSMGPGLFSVPYLFKNIGYINGLLFTFFTVFLYAHNIRSMVKSEYEICKLKQIPNMTYSDVVFYAFKNGPSWLQWFAPYTRYISYVAFLAVWFGGACYGFILISQILKTACNNLFQTNFNIFLVFKTIFLPLTLLCLIRKLHYLVPFSILGSIICNCLFMLILYYIFIDSTPWTFGQKFVISQDLPLFMGTVLFNLNITGFIIPLKNDMRNPRKFNSSFGVLNISYTFIAFIYITFSFICCIKYGTNLHEDIIENLPTNRISAQMVLLLSAVVLIFQTPFTMYVIIEIIWNNIFKKVKVTSIHPIMWEYVMRVFVALLIFVITYIKPNITLFLSFSGTVFTSIDSLILPALVQILVVWSNNRSKRKFTLILLKNILIIVIAITLVINGVLFCINDIYQ